MFLARRNEQHQPGHNKDTQQASNKAITAAMEVPRVFLIVPQLRIHSREPVAASVLSSLTRRPSVIPMGSACALREYVFYACRP